MKELFKKVNRINSKLKDDHISEYAAECAYFTILSFIPFIMFFLTLIQYTSIDKETIVFFIRESVPSVMSESILGVIDEVYSKSVGTVSITALIALWSASKGFYYLSKGLRKIYNTNNSKLSLFVRIEGLVYTLLFIVSIIIFLLIMLLGKRIHYFMLENFKELSMITGLILKIRGFALIIGMFLICLMIYSFIPKHKKKIRTQVYGALFVSIAWFVISWCFSVYIDKFNGFRNTYGSLSSIILIMIWVYICMFSILLGAELNTIINKEN